MSEHAFEQAVSDIIGQVRAERLAGIRGSVWSAMVAGFRTDGYCHGRIADVIEHAISARCVRRRSVSCPAASRVSAIPEQHRFQPLSFAASSRLSSSRASRRLRETRHAIMISTEAQPAAPGDEPASGLQPERPIRWAAETCQS